MIYLTGTLAVVLKGALFVLAVLVLAVAVYLFPLMTRYDNALREHVKNAMILAVAKLPRTVVMVLVTSLPVLVPYFSLPTFFQTLPFFFIIGFSFMSYVSSQLLVPVFQELEGGPGGAKRGAGGRGRIKRTGTSVPVLRKLSPQ